VAKKQKFRAYKRAKNVQAKALHNDVELASIASSHLEVAHLQEKFTSTIVHHLLSLAKLIRNIRRKKGSDSRVGVKRSTRNVIPEVLFLLAVVSSRRKTKRVLTLYILLAHRSMQSLFVGAIFVFGAKFPIWIIHPIRYGVVSACGSTLQSPLNVQSSA
jgi:hypothetical protein